jgi:hypothetical protein
VRALYAVACGVAWISMAYAADARDLVAAALLLAVASVLTWLWANAEDGHAERRESARRRDRW